MITPRPFAVVVLLVVALAALVWERGVVSGGLAIPVAVEVASRGVCPVHSVASFMVLGGERSWSRDPGGTEGRWVAPPKYLTGLRVTVDADSLSQLSRLDIAIGDHRFSFTGEQVAALWRPVTPTFSVDRAANELVLESPPSVCTPRSHIAFLAPIMNWRGDRHLLPSVPSFLALLGVLGLAYWLRQPRQERLVRLALGEGEGEADVPEQAQRRPEHRVFWFLWGLALIVVAATMLEVREPYYFTQDDAFAAELPGTIWMCRVMWGGRAPEWNPCQFMGSPVAATGMSGFTYPPTLAAYAIARAVLRNEYLTFEVFAIGHLLAGFVASWWALRLLGLRPGLTCAAALSFVLSGYLLIAGRSWHATVPLVVWLPLLVGATALLVRGNVTWRWACVTGLTIGALFHVGFVQHTVYAVTFFLLAALVLVATGRLPVRRGLWALPALGIGLALAAPVAVPQVLLTRELLARKAFGAGIAVGLPSMLVPYPLARAVDPNDWVGRGHEYMGQLYYSGTLLCLVTFAIFMSALAYRWRAQTLGRNVWVLCAAVAFVLALGREGIAWRLVGLIPVVGKFNHPFRLMPWFNLFAACGAGLCLERLLKRVPGAHRWETVLVVGVSALLLYHVSFARSAFWMYGDKPYPELPSAMQQVLSGTGTGGPQRLLSVAGQRSAAPGYVVSLRHTFPSLYSLIAADGYDPVTAGLKETSAAVDRIGKAPLAAARAYGIRWIIEHRSARTPEPGDGPTDNPMVRDVRYLAVLEALKPSLRRRLELPGVVLWELPDVAPMAFTEAAPTTALPAQFHAAGADVDVSHVERPERVVLNMLWRRWMQVDVDGTPVAAGADEWGRIRADLPSGAGAMHMRYRPPWRIGVFLGLTLAAGSAILGMALSAWQRRAPETESPSAGAPF